MKKRKIGFVEKEGKRGRERKRIEKCLKVERAGRKLLYCQTAIPFYVFYDPIAIPRFKGKVARNFRLTSR